MKAAKPGDLQDGMLAYYLSQARASDVNVEARLNREPFDYRSLLESCSSGGAVAKPAPWPPKA